MSKGIFIQRIYDDSGKEGYRVLVDRLWPRGISKDKASLDDWWKDIAPSTVLRQWFGHQEDLFDEFRINYLKELNENKEKLREYLSEVPDEQLILLYGAKSPTCNHAVILKEYLDPLRGA